MKPFTYHAPRSVEEALSLLEQHQAISESAKK